MELNEFLRQNDLSIKIEFYDDEPKCYAVLEHSKYRVYSRSWVNGARLSIWGAGDTEDEATENLISAIKGKIFGLEDEKRNCVGKIEAPNDIEI